MTSAATPTALRPLHPEPAPVPARPLAAVPGRADGDAPPPAPRLRLLRYEPDPAGPPATATPLPPAPPVPAELRETVDLRRRTHQVLCLVLEVLDGRRPVSHLTAHLEPPAVRYVRAAAGGPHRPPFRLTSLHVSRPCAGAVEVAAVRRAGGRAQAVAARFEGRPDTPARWRCVTVRLL